MSTSLHCDQNAKWPAVCAPLAAFVVVMGVALWSTTIIPRENVILHGAILTTVDDSVEEAHSEVDCDVCVVVYVGDDGWSSPSERNLPFSLLHKLFEKVRLIKKPAERDKVVCVVVDHPAIVCRMVVDALGPDANCWRFEEMPLRDSPVRCNHMVMGESREYLPQLDTLENQTSTGFVFRHMHVVDLDAIADTGLPLLVTVRPTIVTGFSANHLSTGLLLLRSIARAAFTTKETNASFDVSVVVWAMEDFRGQDRDDLLCVVKAIIQPLCGRGMMKEAKETYNLDVDLRPFKFWQHPRWMRIHQSHQGFNEFGTGEYAWKVLMIYTVLLERGLVFWADAGNRFTTPTSLPQTLNYIAQHGFASRTSSGTVGQWTHAGTMQYLRAGEVVSKTGSNCDGSAVGLSLGKYWQLARPWYECATTKQCIAPDGSNRTNHRQDQAALTVLAGLSGSACRGVDRDVAVHRDYDLRDVEGAGAAASACYADPRRS